ncbi:MULTISPECIES: hypothetical protein [unclassified Burkholderia]|uniref:hypothetical protein n=1 Tax=unclassified Burkholderia TaxID=2613784 RepID=UPI0009EB09C3|nr:MULTISPECIES: hypothetical protein [unclassified Burkholderia]
MRRNSGGSTAWRADNGRRPRRAGADCWLRAGRGRRERGTCRAVACVAMPALGSVADFAAPVGPARLPQPVPVRRRAVESEGGWRPIAFACTIAAR